MPERERGPSVLPSGQAADVRGAVDEPGLLIYERVLPALASSVARIRHELLDTLARHDLAADRRADIALVVSEAATNAVVHAYRDTAPGPLYAAATLGGDSLTVWMDDFGRGMLPRRDSPGLGLGVALMTRLSDDLQCSSHANAAGTCVTATSRRSAPHTRRSGKTLTLSSPRPSLPSLGLSGSATNACNIADAQRHLGHVGGASLAIPASRRARAVAGRRRRSRRPDGVRL